MPELTKVGRRRRRDAAVGTVVKGWPPAAGWSGPGPGGPGSGDAEFDDGDILVCENTDPSWISLFMVAAAVVTDQGGMLSHGPIVARELGLPCVCGTEDGSRRIGDGQMVRVDGDAGPGSHHRLKLHHLTLSPQPYYDKSPKPGHFLTSG